jgi:hypothetical protein
MSHHFRGYESSDEDVPAVATKKPRREAEVVLPEVIDENGKEIHEPHVYIVHEVENII